MAARMVLIGAPGSGKSTVGPLLASRWAVPAVDTDAEIEGLAGMPVSEIFTVNGESEFRVLEEQVCLAAFADDAVVSVGGGAVMNQRIQAALGDIPTVWLQATVADIAERIKLDVPRPLLMGDTRKQLNELLNARTPVYEALADLTVVTSGKTPSEIADEIQVWRDAR